MLLVRQRITDTTIEKMKTWRSCSGFSVHSQTRLSGCDQEGNEQLARYIGRNPVSQENMSLSPDGKVIYRHGAGRLPGDKDQLTMKIGTRDGRVMNVAPECDDCLRAAREHGVPLKTVYAAAMAGHVPEGTEK